ncbi:MAG: hypothetical protein OXC07_06005 [Kistimonas sp.]|nr:hypothetical protein [Kistimonas sp.]
MHPPSPPVLLLVGTEPELEPENPERETDEEGEGGKRAEEQSSASYSQEAIMQRMWVASSHCYAWLVDNKDKLRNALLTFWHGQETLQHGTQVAQAIQSGHWAGASLELASLVFHFVEILEHSEYHSEQGIPEFILLSRPAEWFNDAALPSSVRAGLTGAALVLALTEHDHAHEHPGSWLAQAFNHLHAGVHLYELWQTIFHPEHHSPPLQGAQETRTAALARLALHRKAWLCQNPPPLAGKSSIMSPPILFSALENCPACDRKAFQGSNQKQTHEQ